MPVNGVSHLISRDIGIEDLPPARREDVLVLLEPPPLHDLARVRLVLLDARIIDDTNIVVHVEMEERTALTPRLGHDEVIEAKVLRITKYILYITISCPFLIQ